MFVMEGEAPKLKAETMSKRTEERFGGFKKASAPKSAANTSRGRFNAVLREVGWLCSILLIPCCNNNNKFKCLSQHAFPLIVMSLVCRDVGLPGCAMGDSCW